MNSPFKFLNAYGSSDKEIFFGREEEIDELYELVFQTDFLLVYGQSGTGKTSLIQCGLAGRFPAGARLEVLVRRRGDLNTSLRQAINKSAETPIKQDTPLPAAIHSLYRDHLCPVHLIFDQFEELFLLGEEAERREFIEQITDLVHSKTECKIIIVMREEFIAHMFELYDFGEKLPAKLRKRFRVEPMSAQKVRSVILKTTEHFGIELEHGKATVNKIQTNLGGAGTQEHLSYLQVYLDTLFQRATKGQSGDSRATVRFTDSLVDKTGKLSDVLADFLRTQTKATQQVVFKHHPKAPPRTVQTVLEAFATEDGTKRPLSADALKKELGEAEKFVDEVLFAALVNRRILRPLGDGEATDGDPRCGQSAATMYELSHDSLARCINASSGELRKKKLRAERIVKGGYSSHQETSVLLSRKELALVKPYLKQLRLSADETDFVVRSVGHRDRNIWIACCLAIAVVAAVGYSVRSVKDSKQESHVSKEATKAAEEAARVAEKETEEAEKRAHALRVTMVATSDEATPEVAIALLREVDEEDSDAGMALLEARLPAALQAMRRASAKPVRQSSKPAQSPIPDWQKCGDQASKFVHSSTDGRVWAVGCADGIRIWEVDSERGKQPSELASLPPSDKDGGSVRRVRVSPSGTKVLGVWDHQARVWSVGQETPLFELVGIGGDLKVQFAEWSPDGERIVTLSVGGRARVWRVNGGNRSAKRLDVRTPSARKGQLGPVDTKPGYEKAVWSRNNKRLLLTGSKRRPTAVWSHNARRWKELSKDRKTRRPPPDRSAVFAGTDDELALVTSQTGELRLWDLIRNSSKRLGAENDYFQSSTVSKKKCQVVGITDQGAGRYFHICDAPGTWSASFSPIPVELKGGYMVSAEFAEGAEAGENADITNLITRSDAAEEPAVRKWELASLKTRAWSLDRAMLGKPKPKIRYGSSKDGAVIVALQGGEALVWAAKEKSLLGKFDRVKEAELSPDGTKILVIDTGRDRVRLCHIRKAPSAEQTPSEDCQRMKSEPGSERRLKKVGFSPSGARAYSLSSNGIVQVWKLQKDKNGPVEKLVLGASRRTGRNVAEVFFTADGTKVVTRTREERGKRALYVRDLVETDASSIRLSFPSGGRPHLGDDGARRRYTPRVLGSKAIALMLNGDVLVWDLNERGPKELTPWVLKGHNARATAVALSLDGKQLATAGKLPSNANGLLVWDLESSHKKAALKPRELIGLSAEATAAAFDHDGTQLVIGSSDRSVRVWNLESPEEAKPSGPSRVLRGNRAAITAVALGPEEQVASGSADGAVRVWKAKGKSKSTAIVVRPPATAESKGDERGLPEMKFAGKKLLSRSASGIASSWVIDPEGVLAKLWEQTPYCISVEDRVKWLEESEEVAKTSSKKCQKKVGQSQANPTTVDSGRPPATVELQGHSVGVTVDRSAARASVADVR